MTPQIEEFILMGEAREDIQQCIEWIQAEMNSPVRVIMRDEDWNWLLARLKNARTLLHNLDNISDNRDFP